MLVPRRETGTDWKTHTHTHTHTHTQRRGHPHLNHPGPRAAPLLHEGGGWVSERHIISFTQKPPIGFYLHHSWQQLEGEHGSYTTRTKHLHLRSTRLKNKVMLKWNSRQNATFFLWLHKCSCKSIITTKKALLRFTIFSFSGQTHFQWECYGHFNASSKISSFTVRRLNTTWNFARSITRVFTHEHKEGFEQLTLCYKNSLFSKLCVHKQCSQCWCSCVETLVMLPEKFHVVSRLLTVLKLEILASKCCVFFWSLCHQMPPGDLFLRLVVFWTENWAAF